MAREKDKDEDREDKAGFIARRLDPSIQRGAEKVKEGLYRVRADFMLGMLAGAALFVVLQEIFEGRK